MNTTKLRPIVVMAAIFSLVLAFASPVGAQDAERIDRPVPDQLEDLKLDSPRSMTLDPADFGPNVSDPGRVIVRLVEPSVAEKGLKGNQARNERRALKSQQNDLLDFILDLDPTATVLAQTQLVLNAVFVDVDTAVLEEIAADSRVARIVPVGDYELDLSETVPYIGASDVQADGFDGSGVRVAVLDSGIDYYHAALGGSGNPADYAADDPTSRDDTFPTAKVVEGYDFVGSDWYSSVEGPSEAPDPDPLDDGPGAGHGTHVGHIIGGTNGVAPGVDLYAVKVCSSISTACSGVALIQGMEFAVDPDMNGDPSDAVDVVNMSLGASYGQPFDDDLSVAVDNATALGVLTVASAGNSADKPYIVGTPSAAPTALSVAQTQVPSAELQLITVDGNDYPAVFQPWSEPLVATIGPSPVQYGDGGGGNLNGCAPFAPGSLTGLIVLVDRGACNFTLKISNISQAGGEAGIIGLVAPGAPFAGGDGGDRPIDIPGYMISQADSNAIKAALPANGTIDPTNGIPLVGQMVGSSSRGPSNHYQAIKPEIGAPGASVSAIAGTGTGEGPFGGTSGAAPMVSGAAALLMQAEPGLSALEVKARLVNTGDTDIDTDPFSGLAPITRIGGGEVRVDDAVGTRFAAWDKDTLSGALSFGFVDVSKNSITMKKQVRVRNYSDSDATFSITPTFRYANDVANGAVSVSAPASVTVKAGKEKPFTVTMTIDGTLLRGNHMNSGSEGANPAALTLNEYDGYLVMDNGSETIHMPWQVLPRQAADVTAKPKLTFGDGNPIEIELENMGVGVAQNDAFALIATSPDQPEGSLGGQAPMPDIRAVGVNTFPVPAGFCSGSPSFIWAFAVNTWERQSHLLPVSHQVNLDTDQDGAVDYVVLNRDLSFNSLTDGRQVTWVFDVASSSVSAFFFAEHSTNTGNTVMYICGEQVGLTGTDMLATNVDASVFTQDFYFGGPGDFVDGLTITPLGERYFGIPEDVAGNSTGTLIVVDFGPFPGNSAELGLMLITNGDRGSGARGGAVQDSEVLLFTTTP